MQRSTGKQVEEADTKVEAASVGSLLDTTESAVSLAEVGTASAGVSREVSAVSAGSSAEVEAAFAGGPVEDSRVAYKRDSRAQARPGAS